MSKRKKIIWLIIIILIGGAFYWGYRAYQNKKEKVEYVTQKVVKGLLVQTVSATGQVKSTQEVDLNFKLAGKVGAVKVKVGDVVKAGDILAQLESSDLTLQVEKVKAALALAQANLDLKLAGESEESIEVAQKEVDKAKASLAKTKTDLEKARTDYTNLQITTQEDIKEKELAVEAAQDSQDASFTDLENTKASNDQAIRDAYNDAKTTMQGNLVTFSQVITDMDDILDVHNRGLNDSFEDYLGVFSGQAKIEAETHFLQAEVKVAEAKSAAGALVGASYEQINSAISVFKETFTAVQEALEKVSILLDYTATGPDLTETELAAKKSTINTDRTNLNKALSSLETAEQATSSAKLSATTSYDTAEASYKEAKNSYEQALQALDLVKANSQSKLASSQAQVDLAELQVTIQEEVLAYQEAVLELKKAPPRAVDVASLEAQVQESKVSLKLAQDKLNETMLIAPYEGTITAVEIDKGEQTALTQPVISMLAKASYEIEVDISEADIAKVEVGQIVEITLDAFGDELRFPGQVVFIEPRETVIQDVIYYKVKVSFDDRGESVKPGMTANVGIRTNQKEDVLIIPQRAVNLSQAKKVVIILKGGEILEKEVATGLRGDEGVIEILSGLEEGEEVVIYVKK